MIKIDVFDLKVPVSDVCRLSSQLGKHLSTMINYKIKDKNLINRNVLDDTRKKPTTLDVKARIIYLMNLYGIDKKQLAFILGLENQAGVLDIWSYGQDDKESHIPYAYWRLMGAYSGYNLDGLLSTEQVKKLKNKNLR
ncbi:hypothetical protein [Photobacterium damselae]|uniref:hypothetical protein n=1 Tax=Photobacterium damselae TaxID=38293 RepID=UPI001F28900B|nr:hypothetical protein [Photobacterium damselae]UKA12905.1 hypothetical protein IHC91_21545 [Photobacterium damselae subsp. damselae]